MGWCRPLMRLGHATEEHEGGTMPITNGLGGLRWAGLDEKRVRMRQRHREVMQFVFDATDHAERFAEIHLSVTWRMR